MLKRDDYLNVFLAIYTLSCLIYIGYVHGFSAVLIPVVALLILLFVRPLHSFFPLAIFASIFFIVLATDNGIYLSLPLTILIPLGMRGRGISIEDPGKTVFFGPSALRVFSYLMPSSLLVLVDLRVIAPVALLSIATLIYTTYSYSLLSRVETRVIVPRNTVAIGEKLAIALSIKPSTAIYVVVDYGVGRTVKKVDGLDTIEIELEPKHFGRHVIEINVYAVDSLLFSSRHVARHVVEYRVTPLTERILDVIAHRFAEVPEILSRIPSLEVTVLEMRGYGSAIAVQGAKALAAIRRYATEIGEAYLRAILRRFEEVLEEYAKGMLHPRRSRYGEYIGCRQYVSGDELRDIHWKKSVSRGMLIVKEFSLPAIELVGGEKFYAEPIVIADLYAPNAMELDKVVYTLLKTYLEIFRLSPNTNSLAVIVAGDIVLGLKGKAIDILNQLYKVFRDLPIQTLFSYSSPTMSGKSFADTLKASRKPRPLAIIVLSNQRFAERILGLVASNGFPPPKPFTVIHSPSLSFRYYVVAARLSEYGFIYTDFTAIPKLFGGERLWRGSQQH